MKVPILLLSLFCTLAAESSFEAVWKKALLPDKGGTLCVGEQGIEFQAAGDDAASFFWAYVDIQHFERMSPTEIRLRTFVDNPWLLDRDRRYRFRLEKGEFDDELHTRVVSRIGKPATDRAGGRPTEVELEIPVKHLTRFGSSNGMLYFTSQKIVYSASMPMRSRSWRLERDIEGLWSSDPYRLEVHVFDGTERFVRRARVFRFALKRALDADYYRQLKTRLYRLDRQRRVLPDNP